MYNRTIIAFQSPPFNPCHTRQKVKMTNRKTTNMTTNDCNMPLSLLNVLCLFNLTLHLETQDGNNEIRRDIKYYEGVCVSHLLGHSSLVLITNGTTKATFGIFLVNKPKQSCSRTLCLFDLPLVKKYVNLFS